MEVQVLERPQREVQEPLLALAATTSHIAQSERLAIRYTAASSVPKSKHTLFSRLKVKFSRLPPTPVAILQNNKSQTTCASLTNSSLTDTSQISIFSSPGRSSNVETATTTTTATSILIVPSIFTFDQIHLAPLMAIEEDLQILWERSIRVRLRTILYHEISAGSSLQELMMAGRRKDALKPAVVVTCGDFEMRANVEKVFKSRVLEWLRDLLKANGMIFVAAVKYVPLTSGPVPSKANHTGLIVGVIVGSSLVLLTLLALVYMLYSRKFRRLRYRTPKPTHHNTSACYFQQCPTELSQQPIQESHLWWTSSRMVPIAANDGPEMSAPSSYNSQRPLLNAMQGLEVSSPIEIPTTNSHEQQALSSNSLRSSQALSPAGTADVGSSQFDAPLTHCVLQLLSNIDTYCGQLLQVSDQCSTFGGIIMVDGQIYGLSVAHVFRQGGSSRRSRWSIGTYPLTTSNTDENPELCIDHSPFWYNEDEDTAQPDPEDSFTRENMAPHSSANNVIDEHNSRNSVAVQQNSIANAEPTQKSRSLRVVDSSTGFIRPRDGRPDNETSDSDWALLSLNTHPTLHLLPNLLVYPGNQEIMPITDTTEGLSKGEVYVLHNSRAIFGTLRGLLSTIQIEDNMYDVQMLLLDETLPVGCSGSWVVADNTLCGHIISARQDVPFAYMVPIHAIFDDIRRRRHTDDVRLPTPSEIAALSDEESDSVRSESPI